MRRRPDHADIPDSDRLRRPESFEPAKVNMALDIDLSGDTQFRLAAEDAPLWPAAAFAVLGAALAFAASAQIFAPPPTAAAPPAVEIAARVASERPLPRPETAPPSPETAPAAPPAETVAKENPVETPTELARPAPELAAVAATAQTPAAPPAPAAPEPSACLPIVSIPFDLNSARLKTTGLDALVTPLRAWLATHTGAVLSVEGHADATGPEAYNVVLSYKRAEAAAAWLAQAGTAPERIAARAAGTRAPSRQAANAVSNRQVILQIEGVEPCRDDGAPAQAP